jgi:Domain of unknown function (DUF4352)
VSPGFPLQDTNGRTHKAPKKSERFMTIAVLLLRKTSRRTMGSARATDKGVGSNGVQLDSHRRIVSTHTTATWIAAQPFPRSLLIFSLSLAAATGCRADPSEGSSNRDQSGPTPAVLSATLAPVRFGEEAKTPHFRVRALNWKPCAVEAHLAPPPGVRKVSVEIELTASGQAEVPSNPFYAQLADRDGRMFESTLAGCPPLLEATRLSSGQSARGWITFDIPEGTVPHSLVYQPAVIGVSPPKVELLLSP